MDLTEGVFLPDGTFLPLPKLAIEPFLNLWEQEVFALLLAEGRITEEVVANMRSWKHSTFSVDQSVRLEGGDQQGVQRLIQYFLRCPFSQARMTCLCAHPGVAETQLPEVGWAVGIGEAEFRIFPCEPAHFAGERDHVVGGEDVVRIILRERADPRVVGVGGDVAIGHLQGDPDRAFTSLALANHLHQPDLVGIGDGEGFTGGGVAVLGDERGHNGDGLAGCPFHEPGMDQPWMTRMGADQSNSIHPNGISAFQLFSPRIPMPIPFQSP
jgi:hypothetical protein